MKLPAKPFFRSAVLAAFAAAAGCSVLREAREAQRAAEPAAAGEPAALGRLDLRGFSLERLVGFALTNRPEMASARLAVEDARLKMKTIAADAPLVSDTPWTAPSISLSGGYSESSPGATASGGGSWRTYGDPSAALSLNVLLYDFGRNRAQARAQAERVVSAENALVETGFTVFDETALAYFNYREKCALYEVALTNEAEYAEHLVHAEARYEAGEVNRLNVLKARLDLATAREKTVSASNLVVTSGAALMDALGVDASRGTCAEVLGAPEGGLSEARRGFAPTTFGIDETFAFARTNSPAMQGVRARLRAASRDVDYALADLRPTVSASLGLNWANPFWVWSWGLSAAQSVFEGFRRTTAVERATVTLESAGADVLTAEQALSVKLSLALATRDNAVEALATSRISFASARENLALVREQFTVGDVSRIELSEAVASYTAALGDIVTAFYAGQRAEAALFAIVGSYPVYDERKVGVK